jgi:putative flavoprotein involved in K+ transport
MELYGALRDFDGEKLVFDTNLARALDDADKTYNGINAAIDKYIAENNIGAPPGTIYEPVWRPDGERPHLTLEGSNITSIVWCIGFKPDFRWLDAPVFNGSGHPKHRRGVTSEEGIYFIGLPWLHTWGSGRFGSVGRDAEFIVSHMAERMDARSLSALLKVAS